jgi:predicted enzyme related to lactoylglutathione lyase
MLLPPGGHTSGWSDSKLNTKTSGPAHVPDIRLELVLVPVSDVERAKDFYEQIFGNMRDTKMSPKMRVVQFAPPGSTCSIVFGTDIGPITEMEPGSVKGLHLVVKDVRTSRDALIEGGVEVSEIQDVGGPMYAWFSDPGGNLWALQQWPKGYDPNVTLGRLHNYFALPNHLRLEYLPPALARCRGDRPRALATAPAARRGE